MLEGGSLRVARVRGIPIRIHVTFLVVLPFLAIAFGRAFVQAARTAGIPPERLGGTPFAWGLGVAVALFASVLLHELAHSLYALRRGGRVRGITLLPIGGVSQLSEPPRSPRHEAVMAAVGPLTSLALGVVFYALFRALTAAGLLDLGFAAFQLFTLNVALGVFNLLPAFPMDGGRVLRAALAARWGPLRATRVAAGAGKVFAILFGIAGLAGGNLLLVVVAFFVYMGADAETRDVLVRALLGNLRVRDLALQRVEPVDPSASLHEAALRMVRDRRLSLLVTDGAGPPRVLTLEEVARVPAEERAAIRVGAVAREVPVLSGSDEATRALRAIGEGRASAVAVMEDGRAIGLLGRLDLVRDLQLLELDASEHARGPGGPLREQRA